MRFLRGSAGLDRSTVFHGWTWSLAVAVACLTAVGCALPSRPGWANFKSDKATDIVASDDSFPAASEVGLAMTGQPAKTR